MTALSVSEQLAIVFSMHREDSAICLFGVSGSASLCLDMCGEFDENKWLGSVTLPFLDP